MEGKKVIIMNEQIDRRNYDVVTIRAGNKKPVNHVQKAYTFDPKSVTTPGKFVKIFANMFLKKEAVNKAYR